jgi:hypothetical protein
MPRSSSVIGARSSPRCIRTCTGCKRTVRLCEGGPRSSACCKRLAYPGPRRPSSCATARSTAGTSEGAPIPARGSSCGTLQAMIGGRKQNWSIGRPGHGLEVVSGNAPSRRSAVIQGWGATAVLTLCSPMTCPASRSWQLHGTGRSATLACLAPVTPAGAEAHSGIRALFHLGHAGHDRTRRIPQDRKGRGSSAGSGLWLTAQHWR